MGIGPSGIARRADNVPFAHLSLSTALTCPPANEKKLKCVRSRSKVSVLRTGAESEPPAFTICRSPHGVLSVRVGAWETRSTSVPQVLYI
uniref:Uncharacterized protein n=1 Tax=Knipowitschia caucasica TaxID=637954 RepID=A0AAV2KUA0_KNICA